MSASACQVIPKGVSLSAHTEILSLVSKGMSEGKAIKRTIKGLSSSEVESYSYSYSYRLCFAFAANDIQSVYSTGPTSCMRGKEDVRLYA